MSIIYNHQKYTHIPIAKMANNNQSYLSLLAENFMIELLISPFSISTDDVLNQSVPNPIRLETIWPRKPVPLSPTIFYRIMPAKFSLLMK